MCSVLFLCNFREGAAVLCQEYKVLNIYPFHHCELKRGKQGSDSDRKASNDQYIHRICMKFQAKKGK